jgi:hypothetical protein
MPAAAGKLLAECGMVEKGRVIWGRVMGDEVTSEVGQDPVDLANPAEEGFDRIYGMNRIEARE